MANPQIEDGYTRIANELFEAICQADFNGGQTKAILAIVRYTYGWNKTEDQISHKQIQELTGIKSRTHLMRILKELEKSRVIKCLHRHGLPSIICLNKDFEEWLTCPRVETCASLDTCAPEDTGHVPYKGQAHVPCEGQDMSPTRDTPKTYKDMERQLDSSIEQKHTKTEQPQKNFATLLEDYKLLLEQWKKPYSETFDALQLKRLHQRYGFDLVSSAIYEVSQYYSLKYHPHRSVKFLCQNPDKITAIPKPPETKPQPRKFDNKSNNPFNLPDGRGKQWWARSTTEVKDDVLVRIPEDINLQNEYCRATETQLIPYIEVSKSA